MPSTQTQPGQRGRRGTTRGRGRGGNRGHQRVTQTSESQTPSNPDTSSKPEESQTFDEESSICWICAEPVKYYSISECNHRTCHICALRLRALYKKNDCTFCKVKKNNSTYISPYVSSSLNVLSRLPNLRSYSHHPPTDRSPHTHPTRSPIKIQN